jgi:hypothetical protein
MAGALSLKPAIMGTATMKTLGMNTLMFICFFHAL